MKTKHLEGKGQTDYDFDHDILFFKTAERDYFKSIELYNLVLDIDKDGFIVGIQIFEASKFLDIAKTKLLEVKNWRYDASINDGILNIRLIFKVLVRNQLVEARPIIIQPVEENLPNSELICIAA